MVVPFCVVPDHEQAAEALDRPGEAREFIGNAYRHCRPILPLGARCGALERTALSSKLPSGEADTGLLMVKHAEVSDALPDFIKAMAMHRHFTRAMDLTPV